MIRGLREEGHTIDHCSTVASAKQRLASLEYDLVLLDWMLPDGDGIELLTVIRSDGLRVPVIVLTARSQTQEKIIGCALARTTTSPSLLPSKSCSRASKQCIDAWMARSMCGPWAGITLDGRKRCLKTPSHETSLTSREYALARSLFEHSGDVRTRAQLLAEVWGHGFEGDPNILDVYIGYLRTKLAEFGDKQLSIRAVRGVGFRLTQEAAWKLRTRLVLIGAVLPAGLLLLSVLATGTLFSSRLLAGVDEGLRGQAAVQVVSLFDGPGGHPHVHLDRSPLAPSESHAASSIVVFDSSGRRRCGTPTAEPRP